MDHLSNRRNITRSSTTGGGIKNRTSSAPRVMVGKNRLFKTVKRISTGITGTHSRLSHRALLTHCNTSVQNLGMSLAMILYGRAIKYRLPALRANYQMHKRWKGINWLRETTMAKRHLMNNTLQHNTHCRPLREQEFEKSVLSYRTMTVLTHIGGRKIWK